MITKESFAKITDLVIKELEGGYFHPLMLKDGRAKDPEGLMSAGPGRNASGETMFGLDRINGAGLSVYPEWAKFWDLIDKAGAKTKWKWYYVPPDPLGQQLRTLAEELMYHKYSKNFEHYLSPKAQSIVDTDPRLIFNFSYATWNGEGYFEHYARLINNAIVKGITKTDELYKILIDERTQSKNVLIRKTGLKIAKLLGSATVKEKIGGGIIITIIIGASVLFFLMRNQNKS